MKYIIIAIIRFYRFFISPLLGNICRFYPSCSDYAIQALEKKGTVKAIYMIICRILKCNPFFDGGYDPLK